MPFLSRLFTATLAVMLVASLAPMAPYPDRAFAEEASPTPPAENALTPEDAGQDPISPCLPDEADLRAYAEDGSLESRLAYQESLDNEEFDAGLIESARGRESAATSGASAYAQTVPTNWESGMGSVGQAHVLALRVTFPEGEFEPAPQFPAGDDIDALQSLIGPVTEGVDSEGQNSDVLDRFPYESLHDYYLRSSYGKLSIDGAAFEYTALHPASYYDGGLEALYVEALEQLDERIDYSKFDGNGDGRIDALYVHFACEDPQWGTTWWSNEQTCASAEAAVSRDGVRLWNAVSLHYDSNSLIGARTVIHETGHVLGLPDLYSYRDQSSTRTGVLTFDMMNTNCGDHNGFSKWMLGWIDSNDITRIVANENGVVVKDGDAEPAAYPPDSVADVELSAYAADSCGGIVAISNSEELITGEGLFSSYYLAQYDDFGNNQSVGADTPAGRIDLPAGFRVFRIQAGLLPSKADFAHNNMHGKVHDQLIELVDPDAGTTHADYDGFIVAEGASEYGCMYHAGDSITPQTSPSTNFYESLNLGFTGLSIDFTAETPETAEALASGSLRVSYSSEFKPGEVDFSIARVDDDAVLNIDSIAFEATNEVQLNTAGSGGGALGSPRAQANAPYPYLNVDGEVIGVKAEVVGKRINITYSASPSVFADAADCFAVFPAETFVIGYDGGGNPLLSPEISVKLDIAELAGVESEGAYVGTNVNNFGHLISNVFATEDGTNHYLQLANGMLRLCTIDGDDPTRVEMKDLLQIETGSNDNTVIAATGTVGSEGFAIVYPTDYDSPGTCLWFDADSGRVTAGDEFSGHEPASLVASGRVILTSESMPQAGGRVIRAIEPQDDGKAKTTFGYAKASNLQNADATKPVYADEAAFVVYDESYTSGAFVVCDASKVAEAVLAQGFSSKEEIADAGFPDLLDGLTPSVTLNFDQASMFDDIAQTSEGYCTVTKTTADLAQLSTNLTLFDGSGAVIDSTEIPSMDDPLIRAVHVAENGSIAAEYLPSIYGSNTLTQHVVFYNDQLERQTDLLTFSRTSGTWLDDGRWLSTGWKVTESSAGAGSPPDDDPEEPAYQGEFVYYTVTEKLDEPAGGNEGGSGGQEEGSTSGGEHAGDAGGGTLPSTADGTARTAFALAGLLVGACGAIALASLKRRAR